MVLLDYATDYRLIYNWSISFILTDLHTEKWLTYSVSLKDQNYKKVSNSNKKYFLVIEKACIYKIVNDRNRLLTREETFLIQLSWGKENEL